MSQEVIDSASEPAEKSAYEKAAEAGIDPRCVPQRLDHEPPVGSEIPYPSYTQQHHDNWKFLFDRQVSALEGQAGDAFLDGVRLLGMQPDRIPALADISDRMQDATGWQIARIPGLLHETDFFELLSRRLFPSTDYIRGVEELDYTPAPDCFHDMFGHMPMLTEPAFADFYQLFGQTALRARGADRNRLERLHWFTVEFGLVRQQEGMRIFGAGILSSSNEASHALSDAVDVRPYDLDEIVEQHYDVWHLQPILYALNSFEQLVDTFRSWARSKGLL